MKITPKSNWQPPKIGAKQIEALERLSNASAVSGNEDAVRAIILEHLRPIAEDVSIDTMGNVLATKKGRGTDLPRVMLAAHMDEVGFMLTHDEGKGIYRFSIVGGIDPRHLPGQAVWVGPKQTPGVIGIKPIHLAGSSERSQIPDVDSLRIDIGPDNSNKAKLGDWAAFATTFTRLGSSLRGKALDDRIGVVNLLVLLEQAPPNIDLLAAFTVQEEIGARGAGAAAYTLNPDMAFALECTAAFDLPMHDRSENTQYRTHLDKGPAIYIGDKATLADPRLVGLLKSTGQAYDIPYQMRQPGMGGTDAGAIHKTRMGIPSVSVSVPGRYLHSPASIVRLDDWKNTVALLHASLSHIDRETLTGAR